MAFLQMDIKSSVLDMQTSLFITIPCELHPVPSEGYRVAYLLHGIGNNHSNWMRNTSVERYANERGIALVMPEVQRSFYTDMRYGMDYFSYITDELPKRCRELFPFSEKREDTFVAGVSMGGYGAFKCALSRPDVFGRAASLSGALDAVETMKLANEHQRQEMVALYDPDEPVPPDCNLYQLADGCKASGQVPVLYFCCGEDDFLLEQNHDFRRHLDDISLAYRYEEGPGEHQWGFWDEYVQHALDFFLEDSSEK
ncbi:alpha/beta hydrolase [Solibaculum mannosilyticum]|uniref:Tributyrin esterase n=1 Tax=Solibaculum mannosilyticum TaxID=2780922 RepID=A0A7I8D4Q5_9FIRM|nr:alpha/beta hydrolase family protein [Solibaculum mannosilyticum]BCI60762.1 tributyrin esterase [Solibaculum mannosilyticum]